MSLIQKFTYGETREVEEVLEPGQYKLQDGTFVVSEKIFITAVQKWTKNTTRPWNDDFWETTAYKKDTARKWEPPPPPPSKTEPPHPTGWWHRLWCGGCSSLPKAEVVK